jgi:hypothetical protein
MLRASSREKVSLVCIASHTARATMNRYSASSDQSDQSELLADHGEDEIGGALGQELQLRLAAVHPALAEYAARAERDLALDDVIAGAERIGLWIEEGQHALALVVVQEMPAEQAAPTAMSSSSTAMMRSDRPAISTSRAPLAAISAAVPRSGCIATSPAGTGR